MCIDKKIADMCADSSSRKQLASSHQTSSLYDNVESTNDEMRYAMINPYFFF